MLSTHSFSRQSFFDFLEAEPSSLKAEPRLRERHSHVNNMGPLPMLAAARIDDESVNWWQQRVKNDATATKENRPVTETFNDIIEGVLYEKVSDMKTISDNFQKSRDRPIMIAFEQASVCEQIDSRVKIIYSIVSNDIEIV